MATGAWAEVDWDSAASCNRRTAAGVSLSRTTAMTAAVAGDVSDCRTAQRFS